MNQPSLLPDEPQPPDDTEGAITIGAVCDLLKADYPSISISKIRYLEDQRLITPKRTAGGYRLYSPLEVERLRTILRLQRDEFLPLRVIRQELESSTTGAFSVANQAKQLKRAQLAEPAPTRRYTRPGDPRHDGRHRRPCSRPSRSTAWWASTAAASTRPTARSCRPRIELGRYGVEPRHLRLFRVAAEREAGLLQQLLAVGLRSRNPERRREALDSLESLAALASHMRHLMLISELREIANP